MSRIDLRAEQVALLRHEQVLERAKNDERAGRPVDRKSLTASAALASAAAVAAAQKLSQPAIERIADMNDAAATQPTEKLTGALAEIAAVGHLVVERAADSAGAIYWRAANQVQGGVPKVDPATAVQIKAQALATFLGIS